MPLNADSLDVKTKGYGYIMGYGCIFVCLFVFFMISIHAQTHAGELIIAQSTKEIEIPGAKIIDQETPSTPDSKTSDNENINKPEEPPKTLSNLEDLPFPARKMRELILTAARSGDIEKLRPYIGYGDDVTMLALGGLDDDPIEFLKSISGDSQGHELLAIITEILESDFVFLEEGTDREIYVWPYFYAYPLDKLTPQQRVNLFRLMTYGDYLEMEAFGAYIFYRIGITPQGRWQFLVAGD
ncbi:MAG: hypothetical protein AB8B49_10945 [Nitratireductor sp.]